MLVNLATEDELSEAVALRLIAATFGDSKVGLKLGRKGNGYLIKKLPSFRQMAKRGPLLVLTDLDRTACAPALISKWSGGEQFSENLLMRVAVREIEAWLLADRNGAADLLGISPNLIPVDSEQIADPKLFLLNLARKAKREVRSELIPAKGAIASQGLGYNRVLSSFISHNWSLENAMLGSASLSKAMLRLQELAIRFHH